MIRRGASLLRLLLACVCACVCVSTALAAVAAVDDSEAPPAEAPAATPLPGALRSTSFTSLFLGSAAGLTPVRALPRAVRHALGAHHYARRVSVGVRRCKSFCPSAASGSSHWVCGRGGERRVRAPARRGAWGISSDSSPGLTRVRACACFRQGTAREPEKNEAPVVRRRPFFDVPTQRRRTAVPCPHGGAVPARAHTCSYELIILRRKQRAAQQQHARATRARPALRWHGSR